MTIEQTSSADEDYVMQLKAQEQVKKKCPLFLKETKERHPVAVLSLSLPKSLI